MVLFLCQSCFSGIIAALSASSRETAFLCFFAPALLYSALKKSDKIFFLSFVYAFFMWFFSSLWLGELSENGYVPSLLISAVAAVGISVVEGILFAVCMLPLKASVRKKSFPVIFILCYILSEYIQSFLGSFSYPWIRLSVSAAPFTAFIQTSSLFGPLFVSFTVLCISVFAAEFFMVRESYERKTSVSLASFVLIFCLLFGIFRLGNASDGETVRVAVLQGNTAADEKWSSSRADTEILYDNLMNAAFVKGAELIITPETAFPYEVGDDFDFGSSVSENADVLYGCFEKENGFLFNAVRAAGKNGSYRKQKLVPFGEYAPFGIFSDIPFVGNVSFGNRNGLIFADHAKIGTVVCFESLFSDISCAHAKNGAEIIAVMSNDSWFGSSSALYRHNCHNILRAVETGKTVVCAANTGVSCVIDEKGKISASSPTDRTCVLLSDVKKTAGCTFYAHTGDFFALIVIMIFLLKIEFFLESVDSSAGIR